MDTNVCIVTGPIGSGKSYVCELLEGYGFDILDLDIVSNNVLNSEEGYIFLNKKFPKVLTNENIDKDLLAKEVFSEKHKLAILENFIHPRVNKYAVSWMQDLKGYGFIEVSAPKEQYREFRTIVLNAPNKLRIQRLVDRGMDKEDIKRRMEIQKPESWWSELGENINNINSEELEKDLRSLLISWGWLNE